MITMSRLLNRIKARLGSSVRQLELSDEELINCIEQSTLKTFSVYYPEKLFHSLNQNDLLPEHGGTYYLRGNDLDTRTILGVSAVYIRSRTGGSQGYSPFFDPNMNTVTSARGLMEHQSLVDITSALEQPFLFQFMPPNKVRITPMPRIPNIEIELKVEHASLSTIHPGMFEHFAELALYDIQIDIFGVRQFFQSISSTYGDINLRIDDFQSAVDKRTELLRLFSEKKLFSANRKKVWVY